MRNRFVPAGLLLASALALAACGGGSVTVKGPDGAQASVGPSGQVSISSSDGSFVAGQGLPEGFPSDVPVPPGFTVASGAKTQVDGKDNYTVTFQADGDQSAAVTTYVKDLKESGFTVDSEFTGNSGGAAGGVWQLSNKAWTVNIISSKQDSKTGIVMNVAPTSK